MKKQTQCERIYKALRSGRVLTSLTIFRVSGSLCANRRMSDLMKDNRRILKGWKVIDGRRFRVWYMVKP